MNNKLKFLLFIIVVIGGVYFYANNHIKDIEEEVELIKADTISKSAQLEMLKAKLKEKELEDLKTQLPSNDELLHILPREFDFYDVVVKLDQLEMNVGIDSIKNVTNTEEKPELYSNLKEHIVINRVSLNLEVDALEYYKIGEFIKEIENLEQLVIIEEVSFDIPGDPYIVDIKLLYFTYSNIKDLQ